MSKETIERTHHSPDDDVVTTVVDLGDVEIKLSATADLHVFTVSGPYSSRIIKEIERISRRCTGSIGLEFRRAKESSETDSRPLRFDPSVIRLLNRLQSQCQRDGANFFLCNPPPRLEEFLRLSGVWDNYRIAGRDGPETTGGAASVAGQASPGASSRSGTLRRRRRSEPVENTSHASKRIYQLNTSLKRTASLEKGLDSAEKCVMKFLPDKPPEVPGFSFAFSYRSSEKVGGDFFDFIWIDDTHIGVSIGDVSGHGIDAALIMGISKKLISIRAEDPRFRSPGDVLKQVNVDVSKDLNRQTFVTALYGVLDIETGDFEYARAGHEEPLLFSDAQVRSISSTGVALGLGIERFFNSQIQNVRIHLEPGSCLLLTTDGISECRNPREAIYSRERLVFECGQLRHGRSASEILDSLLENVQSFADGRAQEDDMTAILIQRELDQDRDEAGGD